MTDLIRLAERVERWKPISGFENYEVSDTGGVRRLDGHRMAWSMPRSKREYPCVHLRNGSIRKRVSVHRLVAVAFLPEPLPGQVEVRHLDGDHMNPTATNLAWGTRKQNAADREAHGTTARGRRHGRYGMDARGVRNVSAKLTDEDVRRIRALAGTASQRRIAAMFNVGQAEVWRIIHRKAWSHIDCDTQDALRSLVAQRGQG